MFFLVACLSLFDFRLTDHPKKFCELVPVNFVKYSPFERIRREILENILFLCDFSNISFLEIKKTSQAFFTHNQKRLILE